MAETTAIARRLIAARSKKGLTQQGLADASGVAAAQISRYESGRTSPRPEVVAKLGNALEVSFEWLLEGRGDGPLVEDETFEAEDGGYTRVSVALPARLVDQLSAAATANGRSVAGEVRLRLELSFLRRWVSTFPWAATAAGVAHEGKTESAVLTALEEQRNLRLSRIGELERSLNDIDEQLHSAHFPLQRALDAMDQAREKNDSEALQQATADFALIRDHIARLDGQAVALQQEVSELRALMRQ